MRPLKYTPSFLILDMELEQLVRMAKNLYEHFHLRKKTILTNDEYEICRSLLSNDVDLRMLFEGLNIIYNNVQFFGNLKVSGGNQNG